GQLIGNTTMPLGVAPTAMTARPQLGFTSANPFYRDPVYDVFTNFGTAIAPGESVNINFPVGNFGLSGVQGINGDFLIRTPIGTTAFGSVGFGSNFPSGAGSLESIITSPWPNTSLVDNAATFFSPFRRFTDVAFDQYGYFSQGMNMTGVGTTG